jgi:transposase
MEIKALPEHLQEEIEELKDIISCQSQEIAILKERIQHLLHRQFGRKSEQSSPEQLSLFDELDTPEIPSKDAEVTVPSHTRKMKSRMLPDHLPRETIHYDVEEEDKFCECGCDLKKIGDDTYEQLEYIPAQVKVLKHVKAKYACPVCQSHVKTAQIPKQPIPKSIATPGLLAHVLVSKYVDHLPLYRQEKMLARLSSDINRKTLSNWIFKCADLLEPLVKLLKEYIINQDYIKADETTVNVLSEKERHKSYMWVAMGGDKGQEGVIFEYYPDRTQSSAQKLLSGISGYLHTDGYCGYNEFRNKEDITSVGCWSHTRRNFFEITKTAKKAGAAHEAVSRINKLYQIERIIKEQSLGIKQTKDYRQLHAKPILLDIKKWLDKHRHRVPPKSALGQAIQYALNQWPYLIVYIEDGRLEIDTNSIERMIKPFALGRKNWLFCGNTAGAKASAIIYSLTQTCLVNAVDPYQYFRKVLTEIPNHNVQTLAELLPWNLTV